MASIDIPAVDDSVSSITPSSLLQHLFQNLIDTKIFRIRAPLDNKRIALSNPSLRGLVDAQIGRNLVFFLK